MRDQPPYERSGGDVHRPAGIGAIDRGGPTGHTAANVSGDGRGCRSGLKASARFSGPASPALSGGAAPSVAPSIRSCRSRVQNRPTATIADHLHGRTGRDRICNPAAPRAAAPSWQPRPVLRGRIAAAVRPITRKLRQRWSRQSCPANEPNGFYHPRQALGLPKQARHSRG